MNYITSALYLVNFDLSLKNLLLRLVHFDLCFADMGHRSKQKNNGP